MMQPTTEVARVVGVVAKGDLSKKITVDVKGEILELKNTINVMVGQLNGFASEVMSAGLKAARGIRGKRLGVIVSSGARGKSSAAYVGTLISAPNGAKTGLAIPSARLVPFRGAYIAFALVRGVLERTVPRLLSLRDPEHAFHFSANTQHVPTRRRHFTVPVICCSASPTPSIVPAASMKSMRPRSMRSARGWAAHAHRSCATMAAASCVSSAIAGLSPSAATGTQSTRIGMRLAALAYQRIPHREPQPRCESCKADG